MLIRVGRKRWCVWCFRLTRLDMYTVDDELYRQIMDGGYQHWLLLPIPGIRKELAAIRTICSHIENLVKGVTKGYRYKMRSVYAHFPINISLQEKNTMVEVRLIFLFYTLISRCQFKVIQIVWGCVHTNLTLPLQVCLSFTPTCTRLLCRQFSAALHNIKQWQWQRNLVHRGVNLSGKASVNAGRVGRIKQGAHFYFFLL